MKLQGQNLPANALTSELGWRGEAYSSQKMSKYNDMRLTKLENNFQIASSKFDSLLIQTGVAFGTGIGYTVHVLLLILCFSKWL